MRRNTHPGRPGSAALSYAAQWVLMGAALAMATCWMFTGGAFVRRNSLAVAEGPEASRRESHFLALLFPKVSRGRDRLTIARKDLVRVLAGLQGSGCSSVGLRDLEDFYAKRRPLPHKAVLIAFRQDDQRGVALADAALRRAHLRGVLFISGVAAGSAMDERRFLPRHMLSQLAKGGAWDIGLAGGSPPPPLPAPAKLAALLEAEGGHPAGPAAAPFRFIPSDSGFNDGREDSQALRVMRLRADRTPSETLDVIQRSWPRRTAFRDDFETERLGLDWVPVWGESSTAHRRLALIPLPRHTGASVSLRGTERWRDLALEFVLQRYRKQVWAYARQKDDGSFVRVGLRGDAWYVEQKAGPGALPTMLGRAAMPREGLPVRVRLVLKGDWAILQLNGRMQFGKALRIDPRVDYGRVQFGVYDPVPRSAFAALSSVRAAPSHEEWIAVPRGGFDGDLWDRLRAEAVNADAISPGWIAVGEDGTVSSARGTGDILAALAGFYRCRLVPMVEFAPAAPALGGARLSEGLVRELCELAGGWEAAGINLRLRSRDGRRPESLRLLARLRDRLHGEGRRLWVTLEAAQAADEALRQAVDGVLRPSERALPGLELFRPAEALPPSGREAGSP